MCWDWLWTAPRSLLKKSSVGKKTPEGAMKELMTVEQTMELMATHYGKQADALSVRLKEAVLVPKERRKPKSVLLSMLRRRRLLTSRRDQLLKQMDSLFQKRMEMDKMNIQAIHVRSLRGVLGICRDMMKDLDPEDVDLVLEELSEAQENVDSISDALAVSTGLLEEHEKEDLEQELLDLQHSLEIFPEVPKGDISGHLKKSLGVGHRETKRESDKNLKWTRIPSTT